MLLLLLLYYYYCYYYLEWLFPVKFCFRAGLACAGHVKLSKLKKIIIVVKTNKDRHILSAARIFCRDSSFSQYKVYADIRGGSLEMGSNDSRVVENGNFQRFRGLFFRKL